MGFLWTGLLIPFWYSLPAQQCKDDTPANVVFVVNGQSGASIPNAEVQIRTSGKNLATDANSKLSFDLVSGSYDLTVRHPYFTPVTKHIEVRDGRQPCSSKSMFSTQKGTES